MDHGGRANRNKDWLKSGEGAGYTSVSYSVKVFTRLSFFCCQLVIERIIS